jgi:predicted  nucleic acid-binding Zn-ribbon protein
MGAEANGGTPVDMRTIDIFVSSPADVQEERAVAEQLIRSVAAEFNLPINVSYSNPLRGPNEEYEIKVEREDFGEESTLGLCPCFWEYPELEGDDSLEQIPNTGQYDLVICILWSRLGTAPVQKCVMPDGSRPRSATDYEVAWALHQSKLTPGFPELHVYRNRATPATPLEPKEKRESLCRQWDAVQEFCAAWEKNGGTEFRECCHDYQDLEEFEDLFREHFRDFLARQLDREIGLRKAQRKARYLESNPFRGLNFFDFEHATLFHGRTKAVWEVLDALKNQAMAKKPFVLVLGPAGSGKSSLVRAGVLPLLTQGGTPAGNGPWRRAVTRPGAGDPFDTFAAALLSKFALPELKDTASPDEWRNLASQLRKDPDGAAARIAEVLDQPRQELDRPVIKRPPGPKYSKAAITSKRLGGLRPKMRLALVVDQLEELFAGVPPVLHRKYIAALCALAKCEGVFIIATLRSDFYAHYQKFPELVELTAFGGRYELQPPTPRGIGNIIRFPADTAGLRFERDPETSRNLDDALVEAAIASPEPLPLLEHLLSRLYQRQLDRKDGLLRWSAYRGLGKLQDALAQHVEAVFLTLKRDEQQALKFVIRHLVDPGRSEEGVLRRRTVLYRDLISSPKYWDPIKCFGGLNQRQSAGAKGLVDRLIKEGLLSADADPKQELLISVPQEALLRRWPGVWQWLSGDRNFFQMRDRLDASLKLWLSRDCKSDDLLDPGIGLAEAETLLRRFGSSLTGRQIEYIRKSLAKQKRRRRVRDSIGLAAIAGLAVFAAFVGLERFNTESRRKNSKQDVQPVEQGIATGQQRALETQLKKAEQDNAQLVRQNADLANNQSALETQLKKAQEEKAQLAKQTTDLTNNHGTLETQLKKAEEKAQIAQNVDLATSQRTALEAELKKAQDEKARLAKQNTDLTNNQSALEAQLKKGQEDKAQLVKQNTDLANSQSALATELKKTEEKAQLGQQNTDAASSQRAALETELKKAQDEKVQLVKQNTELTNNQTALTTELKKAQDEKAQLAKQNTDLTNNQGALTTELKKAQDEQAKLAKQKTDLANNQTALTTGLKKAQDEKAQLAKQSADLTNNQTALTTELKKAQDEKAQLVKQNTDLTNNQTALETELKKAEVKAQQNTDVTGSQRTALEAELKKAQDEKAQLAKQNAELTNNQTALETKLKKAEEKAEQNIDVAGSQRAALEAELEKAQEEKAQLTQQNADLATSQRTALEAELKNEQEKLLQVQANLDRAASRLSELEAQLTQEQERAQKAQANAEPETSNPPESQFDRNAEASGEEEFLKEFVLGYLRTVASNDTSMQRQYFAEQVNFYGRGVLNSSNIEASTQRYHDEWPIRKWAPRGDAKVLRSNNPNLFIVYQPFNWSVSDGSQNAHGDATLYLRIRKNSQGEFRIVYVRQLDH